jgi:thermitase
VAVKSGLENLNITLIDVNIFEGKYKTLSDLLKRSDVEFAEEDITVYPIQQYPNDPRLPEQWHMYKMRANIVWLTFADTRYKGDPAIIMANLDTGVNTNHEDLRDLSVPGWNMASNNSDTADIHGHGTMTAGCMLASSDNGVGIAGTNWYTRFMPIRITNATNGGASLGTIAAGITWAMNNGVKIVSCSYSSVNYSATILEASRLFKQNGGLVFLAAGNGGARESGVDSPYAIAVSATDSNDNLSGFSSYGPFVDISAPGSNILTTNRGGGYSFGSGTSFSSPTAAGFAGIVWAINPLLTPDDVEQIIKLAAIDLGIPGWDEKFGWGRVDLFNTATSTEYYNGDRIPPVANIIDPVAGTIIKGKKFDAIVNATDNVGVTRVDFYVNDEFRATSSNAPWEFRINLPPGRFRGIEALDLYAIAYDAAGNFAISPVVTVYRQ